MSECVTECARACVNDVGPVCVLGHRVASTCTCFGISYCVQMSLQISSSQREPNASHKAGEAASGAAPFRVFNNVLVGVMMDRRTDTIMAADAKFQI